MLPFSSMSGLIQLLSGEDEDVGFGHVAKRGFIWDELLLKN